MTVPYYIISSEDAHAIGVASFRRGNLHDGYVVTVGDLVTASQEIKDRARPVSEQEAKEFIKKL